LQHNNALNSVAGILVLVAGLLIIYFLLDLPRRSGRSRYPSDVYVIFPAWQLLQKLASENFFVARSLISSSEISTSSEFRPGKLVTSTLIFIGIPLFRAGIRKG
jgi:hypothetical protein